MKRRLTQLAALLLLLALCLPASAEENSAGYTYKRKQMGASYQSDSLVWSIEEGRINRLNKVYVIRIWMQEPGQQIMKATSKWHESLAYAEDLANKLLPAASLVINGSGYVSKTYPWIPEDYPGTSEDYYYTPLGSITVTDGKVYRNLEGVKFYGLTLEADGLHMYAGEDNETVLSRSPTQTWSFYDGCPLILDGESILDRSWDFANRNAIRTIIAKVDEHNYVILIATSVHGLTLPTCTDYLLGEFQPEWAYNLDGGPSTALYRRRKGNKTLKFIYGAGQRIVDVMGFRELPRK